MKHLVKIVMVAFLLYAISACRKNGTGGKADISATVIHHDHVVPYTVIYIKYGAKDFPGTNLSNYNDYVTTDQNGHADISHLRQGDYYLYGVGYDSTIMSPIGGGGHISIKWSQRKKTIAFTVPVTEI
ncbi:MAG: hypothetical protein ACXVPN_07895 [Bacteroidia bacterium]